jgi:hypothetical protein
LTLQMAEGEGIEPLAPRATLVFKTSCRPFSGTFLEMVRAVRFELTLFWF